MFNKSANLRIKISVYLIFLSAIVITSFSGQVSLDLMQLSNWKIIVAQDASTSEKFAAQEFQNLFDQATGHKLEILDKPLNKKHNIFIGDSNNNNLLPTPNSLLPANLGSEGLRINITSDNIYITGGKPRGTLYGVYEFAEKYLGIRFLTFDDTYIPPQKSSLNVPCGEYSYKPCFIYRSSFYKENIDHPEFSVRLHNNAFEKDDKYGGVSNMQFVVHSFYRQLPVETYGKEHPEYFAEVGGKRLLEAYGGGPQIDVTNPDVIKIMTKAVLKEIKEHPEYKDVSVVQNDNQYYCRCKNCEAINQREGSPMGAHLAMVNAIADSVAKVYPDVLVGTLAYQYTRKPPKTIVPRDNVMIQLCSIECDLLHPYNDPDNTMNKPFADDLAGWGKISKNLWIWDYMVDYYCYELPFPNLKSIGKNLKYYKDNNVKGVFMEANYSTEAGEMSDLRNYVVSNCLWNPELDSWQLTKEFCNLYYKKAAKPILEYLTVMQDNVDKNHLMARFNAKPYEVGIDAKMAEYIFSKFQEAMKLADDDVVRSRVEKASLCAYVAMLETDKGEAKVINDKLNWQSSDQYKNIMKQFPVLAKKYDMKYYYEDEDGLMSVVEKMLNNELNVYAHGGRPAAQLENNSWKLTLLTDEDGNMTEMLYKPANFNFLPAYVNNLNTGLFKEYFIKGKDDKDTIKFKSSVSGNTLSLHSALKDGTIYNREITLDDASGKIICKTTVVNKTNKDKTYQLAINPVFDTGKRSRDYNIIKAFVKNNTHLAQFNKGLIGNHGPDENLISTGKDGGEFVLFNTERKIGIRENFDPQSVEALNASWVDSGSLFNLGFNTKTFTLKPGESYSYSYNFEFINKIPD